VNKRFIALVICVGLPASSFGAEAQGYGVKYSGGSLPDVKSGQELTLFIGDTLRLEKRRAEELSIPASAVTDLSYGQEVHHRIGTAVGLAVVSLGIGALVAFSKSKKHFIGIVWDDQGKKGGAVFQADKNEYRGVLAALEGVTGKKAVDTDEGAKNKNK
jgi:hypothetical protein